MTWDMWPLGWVILVQIRLEFCTRISGGFVAAKSTLPIYIITTDLSHPLILLWSRLFDLNWSQHIFSLTFYVDKTIEESDWFDFHELWQILNSNLRKSKKKTKVNRVFLLVLPRLLINFQEIRTKKSTGHQHYNSKIWQSSKRQCFMF